MVKQTIGAECYMKRDKHLSLSSNAPGYLRPIQYRIPQKYVVSKSSNTQLTSPKKVYHFQSYHGENRLNPILAGAIFLPGYIVKLMIACAVVANIPQMVK